MAARTPATLETGSGGSKVPATDGGYEPSSLLSSPSHSSSNWSSTSSSNNSSEAGRGSPPRLSSELPAPDSPQASPATTSLAHLVKKPKLATKLAFRGTCYMSLWLDCILATCLLVLGGKDDLVPIENVRGMMRKTGRPCRVLYHPSKGLGGWLFSRSWEEKIVDSINGVVTLGEHTTIKSAKVQ